MIPLIGLCGRRHSGKSTAAQVIIDRYGSVRVQMPDPIKDMLRVLGLSEEQLNGDLKETPAEQLCGQTPRFAMEQLGEVWGRRTIGSLLWTNYAGRRVDELLAAGKSVLVDGIRNPDEANFVRERGGIVIRITRPATDSPGTYPSESLISDCICDWLVINNGSREAFAELLVRILERPKEALQSANVVGTYDGVPA